MLSLHSKFGSTNTLSSIPHSGIPGKWDKHPTKVKPFSFDNRDKDTNQKKQDKIQKVRKLKCIVIFPLLISFE